MNNTRTLLLGSQRYLQDGLRLFIDGNNLGWRAFGQAPLSYNGIRTEVIRLGLGMVRSYIELFAPEGGCAVVWDGGRDPGRVALCPSYKQKKKVLTETERQERQMFFEQLANLRQILSCFGIDQYLLKNREADDVLWSLLSPGFWKWTPVIISTDEDMYQLFIRPDVVVYSPQKHLLMTREMFEQQWKISPNEYVSYKAMVGDPSDNLPGVRGIGPKKAMQELLSWRENRGVPAMLENPQFQCMRQCVQFVTIPPQELQLGFFPAVPKTLGQLQERVIKQCTHFGFDYILATLGNFILPFEQQFKARFPKDEAH